MIISKLQGGLGNQLFQYALSRVLSFKLKRPLYLIIKPENQTSGITQRNYELSNYNIHAFTLLEDDIDRMLKPFSKLNRLVKPKPHVVKEKTFQFDPTIFKTIKKKRKVILDGYWQSDKYFSSYRNTLLNDLELAYPLSLNSSQYLEKINKHTSVSLHIRRSDYVTNTDINKVHGILPLSYYDAAIKLINKQLNKDLLLVVFSDDMPWVKSNLKASNILFIEGNQDRAPEDMYLMSQCDHNIIANSTFSWWGAWLNPNPNKIVVAPKKWFNDISLQHMSNDLLPDEWIKL